MRLTLPVGLALALSVAACSRRVTPPPPRPVGVPADAVWAGGLEGGAFIRCVAAGREPTTAFDCVVFHERAGDVIVRGRFVTRPTFETSLRELRRSYAAFDGSAILLVNGVALTRDSGHVPFAGPSAPARD